MFDEDLAVHLIAGLEHFEFAREMLLRIGNPGTFDRYGWAYGEEAYNGVPDTQVVEEQLLTILKMTEPRLAGDIYFVQYLNEGSDEWWTSILHPDGTRVESPDELPLWESDFGHALIISSREAALLERYRAGIAQKHPGLEFFVYNPEPPPRSTMRPRRRPSTPPEPTRPNFLLLVDPCEANPIGTIYDLIRSLVAVWELEKDRPSKHANSGRGEQTFTPRTTFGPQARTGRRSQ